MKISDLLFCNCSESKSKDPQSAGVRRCKRLTKRNLRKLRNAKGSQIKHQQLTKYKVNLKIEWEEVKPITQ